MLIKLENVSRQKHGNLIINDVSWQIDQGEKWLLYGLNGAGKTTLLNIMNVYEPITSGEITLFGKQPGTKGYSADIVRDNIGFVSNSLMNRFQEGEKVIDVVLSGLFKSIGLFQHVNNDQIELARKQLEAIGMEEFENQYYGYLSTGERQKVLIARAMMTRPKLLILDEPVSGLDFITREDLLNSLEEMFEQHPELAVIYLTHFIEEITPAFKKGFLLKDGVCYKQGNLIDIMNSHTLSDYFNREVILNKQYQRYSLFLKDK